MKTAKLKINEKQLVSNLRHAFTSETHFVAEMMQNARRSGATEVRITYEEQEDGSLNIGFLDNGSGVDDMQDLLNVASSGWGDEVTKEEKPFGMGWMSALFSAKSINVISYNKCMQLDTASILDFGSAVIKPIDVDIEGTYITMVGVDVDDNSFRSAVNKYAAGYGIDVWLNNHLVDSYDRLDKKKYVELESCFIAIKGKESIYMDDGVRDVYAKEGDYGYRYARIYLQGVPCVDDNFGTTKLRDFGFKYDKTYRGGATPIVIHLKSDMFTARMPDRDKLIDEKIALRKVAVEINEYIRGRLLETAGKLGDDFVGWSSFFDANIGIIRSLGEEKIFNMAPVLPQDCYAEVTEIPYSTYGWGSNTDYIDEDSDLKVPKAEVMSGEIQFVSVENFDSPYMDESFSYLWYAYRSGALLLKEGSLDDGHWVYDQEIMDPAKIESFAIGITMTNLFSSSYVHNNIVLCKSVTVGTRDDTVVINDECVFNGYELFVPEKATSFYNAMRQISNFEDDSDNFDESALDRAIDEFEMFVSLNRTGDINDFVTELVRRALRPHVGSFEAGQEFTIIAGKVEDGNLYVRTSHTKQEKSEE